MLTIFNPARQALGIDTDDVVDGRYRIVQQIADGGMGTVFLAEHVLIKRRFAIKFLHRELASDTAMVQRFMNEALAAGTLGHPHIVEATDMGFTADGVPYIVFEYLEGSMLTEEIYRVGGMTVRRALRIARQIASALECAHNAGIVHLDLKSDNVYLTDKDGAQDHVKILDFGIARFLEADVDKTQRCLIAGTPEYMAPEQIMSPDQVDKRADVYALGVLLFEMLTARRPFAGDEDPRALMYRICYEPARPLARAGVPLELDQLILERMLAKDPARRFQSMREVEEALALIHAECAGSSSPKIMILPDNGRRITPPRGVPMGTLPPPVPASQTAATQPAMVATPVPRALPVVAAFEPRRRIALGWIAAALVAGVAGGALMARPGTSSGGHGAARQALAAEAAHLATSLQAQASTAQDRAANLAMAPMLRAAIETDAATLQDLAASESLFAIGGGERLEVFLLHGERLASAVRIPSAGAPLVASAEPAAHVGVGDGGLAITATAPVTSQRARVAGALAFSMPLDLAGFRRQVAVHARDATLVGFETPIAIAAGSRGPGERISIRVPFADGFVDRPVSLEATLAPVAAPVDRTLAFTCFGLAALLLLVSAARTARRTAQPG